MPAKRPKRPAPKPLPRSIPADSKVLEQLRPAKEYDGPIIGKVKRHLLRLREEDTRDTTVIHPSEVCKTGWCPRATYYQLAGAPGDEEVIAARTLLLFLEGHNIHDKWQTWLWQLGELEGVFECLVCRWRKWAKSPKRCPRCRLVAVDNDGPRHMRYREVPVSSPEHMIYGHADGIDEGILLEIKSVGMGTIRMEDYPLYARGQKENWTEAHYWREVRSPFKSHLRQAWLYSALLGYTRARILYDWKAYSDVKVFEVELMPEAIEDRLELCIDIKEGLEDHKAPRRPQWADQEHKTCKACPYQKTCWTAREGRRKHGATPPIIDTTSQRLDPPSRRRRPRQELRTGSS